MNRQDFKFEICANSVESCIAAQDGGADRVELCAGIPEGGTTPSYGEIKIARRLLTNTLLHVIIRPRGGDFLYTPLELERMEEDIVMCRQLGVDGVVIGCLTAEGNVDMEASKRLTELAKPMSVTFHRAFDRTADPMRSLEDIISLGCSLPDNNPKPPMEFYCWQNSNGRLTAGLSYWQEVVSRKTISERYSMPQAFANTISLQEQTSKAA